ncbi:MAG TPA: DUF294 nucleotidyltransferase-like domain-containing protein, partial [Chthonomonadales bacterium]|nr:DUF294 nucleotidyltransferase-like domain-containing protein [Chthonomonadales bacterium]
MTEVLSGREPERSGLAAALRFSDLTDAVIVRMFSLACTKAGAATGAIPIAIVATGGYGRQELCVYSDIDITFVPQRDGDPDIEAVIREMFRQLMDVFITRCGLEVGYAYRLLEDCAHLDHQTTCGLLDARLICGSERLFIRFEDAFWSGFNPAEFVFAKRDEREETLDKLGRLPRVVEPELKEGPGGLRDLHTAVWMAQAQSGVVAARVRGDRALEMLQRSKVAGREDAETLRASREFLIRARNVLHAATGTARDQLVVTRQEEVAAALAAAPSSSSSRPDAVQDRPAVERLMSELYDALAANRRICASIVTSILRSRMILGLELDADDGEIAPATGTAEVGDPGWLVWACELAQRYHLHVGDRFNAAARSLMSRSRRALDGGRASQAFTRLLDRFGDVYPALQRMA